MQLQIRQVELLRIQVKKYLPAVLLLAAAVLRADDPEAAAFMEKGLRYEADGRHTDAAEAFRSAEITAATPDLKLRAAQRVAGSYRKAGYLGREFEALERLLKQYPTKVDVPALVAREFEIGDAFYNGYRDPAFWSLRFVPWLTDQDRTIEVYEAALKHAPYARPGGDVRLRMAVRCMKKNDNDKAMKLLREVIRAYPDTEAARFAMLELGNILFELSKAGDGDGRYFEEAIQVFHEFREKHPELSENKWVTQCIAKAEDVYAERLYGIAKFYHREGRNQPAEIYLLDVLRRFPHSTAAAKSEALLTELDKTYFPEKVEETPAERYPEYPTYPLPDEDHRLILAPENSNHRFLLPIYDLNLPRNKEK